MISQTSQKCLEAQQSRAKLNILFYIPRVTQQQGGVYNYAIRILDALISTQHQVYVLNFTEPANLKARYSKYDNIIVISEQPSFAEKLKFKFLRVIKLLEPEFPSLTNFKPQTSIDVLCRKYKIDIIHSPHQGYPNQSCTKLIFTLHDLQELYMPENFSPLQREVRAKSNRIGYEIAAGIIVSYDHVKRDVMKYFGVNSTNVYPLFIGASDNSLIPRMENPDFDEIEYPYLLYPAATWPHKNHKSLIRAFRILQTRHPKSEKLRLICTGHKTEYFNELVQFISENQLEAFIEFKGVVSDSELKALYQQCLAVVVPTRYEAGSFPLMEAIAQAIPVICSNVTSLPETIADDRFTFDPDNVDDIADKMKKIAFDKTYRENNISNSLKIRNTVMNQPIAEKLDAIYTGILCQ